MKKTMLAALLFPLVSSLAFASTFSMDQQHEALSLKLIGMKSFFEGNSLTQHDGTYSVLTSEKTLYAKNEKRKGKGRKYRPPPVAKKYPGQGHGHGHGHGDDRSDDDDDDSGKNGHGHGHGGGDDRSYEDDNSGNGRGNSGDDEKPGRERGRR